MYKSFQVPRSVTRFLLLLLVQSQETATGNLDDFESDTRNISDGVTATTETGDQDFVILIDEGQATIIRDEGGDLLTVLDELNTAALYRGWVLKSGIWGVYKNEIKD